jgi:CubicO group peptidase (beta-lactamase class C family)
MEGNTILTILQSYLLFIIFSMSILGCKSSTSIQPIVKPKNQLQEKIHEARVNSGVPALVVAAVTSHQVFLAADGVRKLEDTTSVTVSDFFHLGSNTKAFTGMLAAKAVDERKIKWDTRVVDILPALASSMLPVYNKTTLEDLLRHRSGLPPFTQDEELSTIPQLAGSVMEQRLAFCKWVFNQPNVAVPRDTNVYSNAGYVVAATMIEQLYNRPYEDLLQEKILQPLGLHAKFGWPASHGLQQPWGHAIGQSGGLEPIDPDAPENVFPSWATPAGNLSMSIEDYSRFLQIILKVKKGDSFLLTEQSFLKILTPESSYAIGWAAVDVNGKSMLYHDGSAGSFFVCALLDFEKDLAVAVFTNSDSDDIEMKMQICALYVHDISLK